MWSLDKTGCRAGSLMVHDIYVRAGLNIFLNTAFFEQLDSHRSAGILWCTPGHIGDDNIACLLASVPDFRL